MSAAVTACVDDIVEAFEQGTIDPGSFDHEAHILVGWRYLQEYTLIEAIDRFTAALRRLTRKLGVASKYHETITWFYLIKIAERSSLRDAADWPEFKRANPDLFARHPGLVDKHYSRSLLSSETAKRLFVLPDL